MESDQNNNWMMDMWTFGMWIGGDRKCRCNWMLDMMIRGSWRGGQIECGHDGKGRVAL
jgi:hypothetical protein